MERFQHYEVLTADSGAPCELGRGAMGITYHARDTLLQREVALKVINGKYLENETARERFRREAQAAARLNHENIATVYQFGVEGDGFFYAMEYIRGETVEAYLKRRGPMVPRVAVGVAIQVCRALTAAEREGLVHRDIKPANLMLSEDHGELKVKVIDFGLAKPVAKTDEAAMSLTVSGFVGTPHFASPEQLEERDLDIRSDLYSLGVTLWYMLDGRPPYSGTFASLVVHHLHSPLPLEALRDQARPLVQVLEKAMAKDRDERFQTPAAFRDALENSLKHLEVAAVQDDMATVIVEQDECATVDASVAPPPAAKTVVLPAPVPEPPAPSSGAPPGSKKGILGAVAVLVLLGVGGAAWYVLSPPASPLPGSVASATPEPVQAETPAPSPPAPEPTPTPEVVATPEPTPDTSRLETALAAAALAEIQQTTPAAVQACLDVIREFPDDPRAAERLNVLFGEANKKLELTNPPLPPEPALRTVAEEAAGLGVVQAMNFLADRQLESDPAEAQKWYKLAVAQKDPHAMTQLALLHSNGRGVPKDIDETIRLLSEAESLGSPAAKFYLAECYLKEFGDFGVPFDPLRAVGLLKESADTGYARAMNQLGFCYDKGIGVQADPKEAVRWYQKAHEQGDVFGTCNLGVFYMTGRGLPAKDPARGAALFREGAEKNNADCQYFFGACLLEGNGVKADPVQAKKFLARAARAGNLNAVKLCQQLKVDYENTANFP